MVIIIVTVMQINPIYSHITNMCFNTEDTPRDCWKWELMHKELAIYTICQRLKALFSHLKDPVLTFM